MCSFASVETEWRATMWLLRGCCCCAVFSGQLLPHQSLLRLTRWDNTKAFSDHCSKNAVQLLEISRSVEAYKASLNAELLNTTVNFEMRFCVFLYNLPSETYYGTSILQFAGWTSTLRSSSTRRLFAGMSLLLAGSSSSDQSDLSALFTRRYVLLPHWCWRQQT